MDEGDEADVQIRGVVRRLGATECAPLRCRGKVPGFARLVSVPEEPGRRFVVMAEADPGRPFFRTDEVQLRTFLHVYGTDEEYGALPSE